MDKNQLLLFRKMSEKEVILKYGKMVAKGEITQAKYEYILKKWKQLKEKESEAFEQKAIRLFGKQ